MRISDADASCYTTWNVITLQTRSVTRGNCACNLQRETLYYCVITPTSHSLSQDCRQRSTYHPKLYITDIDSTRSE